jgi:hypothetical protein
MMMRAGGNEQQQAEKSEDPPAIAIWHCSPIPTESAELSFNGKSPPGPLRRPSRLLSIGEFRL